MLPGALWSGPQPPRRAVSLRDGSHSRPRSSHYPWPHGQMGTNTPSGRSFRRTELAAPSGFPGSEPHSPVLVGKMEGRTLRIPAVLYPREAQATRPDNLSTPSGSMCAPHRLVHLAMPSQSHSAHTPVQSYWGAVLGEETPESLPPPKLGMYRFALCPSFTSPYLCWTHLVTICFEGA